jgi:hypothetical protein
LLDRPKTHQWCCLRCAECWVLSSFFNEGDRLIEGIGTIRNNAKGKDFARKGVVKAVKQPPRFVDGMNRCEAEAAPGKTNPYVKYTEQTMDQRTVLASLHASSRDAGARRELDISVVPRRKGKDRGDFRKAPVLLTRPILEQYFSMSLASASRKLVSGITVL